MDRIRTLSVLFLALGLALGLGGCGGGGRGGLVAPSGKTPQAVDLSEPTGASASSLEVS